MSVYLVKGKGWRYDFTKNGVRHTATWFRLKADAQKAEAKKREELEQEQELEPEPPQHMQTEVVKTPTDMAFLDLVNRRLDHVKAYNSQRHYTDYLYLAKRWVKLWGKLLVNQISQDMLMAFLFERTKVSNITANKELRYLRATFRFGIQNKCVQVDPTEEISFFPTEEIVRMVPSSAEIDRVIAAAEPDTQDYLWTMRDTLARVSEVNRLTWNDVDFNARHVILYTRKRKGGSLTPRKVLMTNKLFEVLSRRYAARDKTKPWVFWHTYWDNKTGERVQGPYRDRKRIMKTLCEKAEVGYFRFHPIRHSGATLMDNNNVPLGAIQKILGHRNRSTTELYLHSMDKSDREAMETFERARERESHTESHTESQTKRAAENG
ncbi:tyrosine-type recombinase/integrase, partial [Candidatus Magnetaquicoccus inordinatus]|uniref:tyrosine-type recombinase/integrase n=1 Tax=Candidatus Magnetaquicoccus inordinatus TaxID=2496818 RepID=UPI00102B2096